MKSIDGKAGEPSVHDRIMQKAARVVALKNEGFDVGHEVLLGFLADLREYVGWPAPAKEARDLWRLKRVNEDSFHRNESSYDLNFPYRKKVPPGGSQFEHKCILLVINASFDFEAKKVGGDDFAPWTILMGGKPVAVDIDPSGDPPEDALSDERFFLCGINNMHNFCFF